ncbi:hypothetical protein [Streptomyces sp. NPDC091027]|uniref:hypothetical protein n=1 Tax=Streptomyces sp. NPDC091027 TaxID=3365971 RepID=UPI0037FA5F7E
MTDLDHTTVTDARGPVNTGPGDQYVIYATTDRLIRRRAESLRISRDDRLHLADRFVPPARYRIAADLLEEPGSVVLVNGRPGSGRRAAAIMLLHRFGEDRNVDEEGVRVEELPVTGKDRDAGSDGDEVPPGRGDRFLLDLSGITDEAEYGEARRRLARHRTQVQEAGAHMVVVLPWAVRHDHPPELAQHTVTLGRPRGLAVLTRYLRMEGMQFRAADLASTDLQRLCDQSAVRELVRLAGLVRDARDSGRFGDGFSAWLGQALHAVTNRADEVQRQVAAVRDTPERALFLAAALFEEMHADIVYAAWQRLMAAVRHEEEATSELGRTDFGARLKVLGIGRDADGRLRFERLAYADAVRTYFWANFPGVRDDLRDWIDTSSELRGLTTDERVDVVVRFCERSLAAGRPDHLFDLAARWADRAPGAQCDPRAVAALELGLGHERLGGWFRRRMYEYVRSSALSDGLARVLTVVCRRSLAATHPDQAVVRLRYLAVRETEVSQEAKEALLELASRDRRLYRLLIDRLRPGAGRNTNRGNPHLDLLTTLLGSDRAPDPPRWPDLFLGWEAVFAQPPTDLWHPLAGSWLSAVADDGTREMALEVMVGATHGRAAALHRLYVIACDWAGPTPSASRAAVANRFWQHIDHARYARTPVTEQSGAGPRTMEEAR